MADQATRDPPALRQELARLQRRFSGVVGQLLGARQRMLRGSFVLLHRKCGKPNCACTRGELHPGRYLSWSEQGRTRTVYVGADDAAHVRTGAERYQRFRQARAELVKISTRVVEVVDALGEALIDSWEPKRSGSRNRRGGRGGGGGESGKS